MGRRITLLGMGESGFTRQHDIARYCEGTEIWGMNNCYHCYPSLHGKWAHYFELHPYNYLKTWNPGAGVKCHFAMLDSLGCPIHVMEPLPIIKRQVCFPLLDICRHLNRDNYFLGTPSMLLMWLLYEHDTKYGAEVEYFQSYGIDQRDGRHAQQRAAWAYWLHILTERGINLGGTSAAFMAERDNDEPYNELRVAIGRALAQEIADEQTKETEAHNG
jgi:hypothetical protein